MDRVPVLFDTDIGSDIDDALALAYLLRQERCDLLGVTTVTGDVAKRAALCEVICRAVGRDQPPIHAGLSEVILHGPGQPEVPQYDTVADRPHRTDYPVGAAIDFLRETIRSRPGEVTLLAVGPFTNLAVLFLNDPEIPSLLDRIVLMGGAFLGRGDPDLSEREWNFLVDPIAGAVVQERARASGNLLSVELKVSLQCWRTAEEFYARFSGDRPDLQVISRMAGPWFSARGELVTYHDPLAAALVFEPEICRYQRGEVENVADGASLTSSAHWQPHDEGPFTVTTGVDPERFFRHYDEVMGIERIG
jgi:purine nucleosidase